MRYRLLIAALITGCLIFPRIEASGGEYDSTDCLALSNFRFDKYGYDLGLSSYLSNEEKSNKSPGLAISISWGTRKCESELSKLNVAQFDVQLSISNYSRSELLPETTKRILSYELATYEYYFRLPAIKPGKYYVEVLVRDLTYSRSPFFNLLEEYDFSVEATPTPTPTPTPTKPISSFRSLYKDKSVWIVGYSAKMYSCWSSQVKALKLQVKVGGKWITKSSAKFGKDPSLCSGKSPWVAKYSWTVDEYGEVPRPGSRSRNLMVREYAIGQKNVSIVSREVYASNSDRIQDGIDAINDVFDLIMTKDDSLSLSI